MKIRKRTLWVTAVLTVTGPADDAGLAELAGHFFDSFQLGADGP